MQISPLAQRLLQLLFALSSAQASLTRPRLEQRLGLARGGLNTPLDELQQLGLLDAARLRLTLSGLARAVACGARSRNPQRRAARKPPEPITLPAPIALFSEREVPRAVA